MADDLTQRPFRSTETIARAPAKPAGSSGNDPLAELARLIGQNDPFAEYGRTQTAAHPQSAAPAAPAAPRLPQYDFAAPASAPPAPDSHVFAQPNFSPRPQFGAPPPPPASDLYQVEGHEPGYAPVAAHDDGYHDEGGYPPEDGQHATEHYDEYDDAAPKRRRMGIMLVAGIFALAVIGSAGALGYRALFGKSGSGSPPPVIKADTTPSKLVMQGTREGSNKLINDRVGGDSEKLVSREEQPIDLKDKGMAAAFPPPADQGNASMPAQGSGVVTPDAKRVRTIAIHPDQSVVADAMPTSAPPAQAAPSPPPQRVTTVVPPARPTAPPPLQQTPPPRPVTSPPPAEQDVEAAPPPAKKPAAPKASPSNAPLSLSPDAQTRPAPRAAAPMRTASNQPQAQIAPAGGSGSYAVQVSSQRSEAEAQAAFRSLQSKYPSQLGNRQAMIHKVDLGSKGIYYRALVGPFATGSEASELCSNLKAAGGSCLIQRN